MRAANTGPRAVGDASDAGSGAAGAAAGGATGAAVPARAPAARATRGQLAFQSFDAFEQRLDARARLAARDAHDRDLEHQARVGDGLLADVDDRLTEDLDRAHHERVAHRLRERRELRLLFGGTVVGDPAVRVGRHERVAQRSQQVVGDAADVVTLRQQFVHADQGARDVVAGDCLQHGHAQVERRAAERGLHRGGVERAAPDGQGLVEQRQRIPGRTRGPAHDEVEDGSASVSTPSRPRMSIRWPVSSSADRSVNSKCCVRERMVGSTLCGIGGREHEHDVRPAAPRASSAACSTPRPRACAPRR